MASNRESAKSRAQRVPLDSHRKRDPLRVAKGRATIAILVVTLGWIAWGTFNPDEGRRRASRGPLANVHAYWDSSCEVCHLEYSLESPSSFHSIGESNEADVQCRSCHDVEGLDHREHVKQGEARSCAACHRDHRGREANLTSVDDRECVRCHQNLDAHVEGSSSSSFADVTHFNEDHPRFRSLDLGDPGRIKFPHARHLEVGIGFPLGEGENHAPPPRSLFTLADVEESWRELYRTDGQGDSHAVQLRCDSCHRPDSAPGRDGALMERIRYDDHCAGCHPITFTVGTTVETMPHGLPPGEMERRLRQLAVDVPRTLAPRGRALPGVPAEDATHSLENVLSRSRLQITHACQKCHFSTSSAFELPEVEPPNIKERWFRFSTFDHSPHRPLACTECHPIGGWNSDPKFPGDEVMIPDLEVCQRCHAPRQNGQGGIRHDCVECHRYHPPPSQKAPLPTTQGLDIEEYLKTTGEVK